VKIAVPADVKGTAMSIRAEGVSER
jgi:hypothetical protein